MTAITSRVQKTENINWKNLSFIQDDNFKEWNTNGDERLMQSIIKYQFADPFKVWQDGDIIYCLDGKHRWKDLLKVEESGASVPELLPATFINCTGIKEAAELVLVYSSAYARITQDGLTTFLKKFDLDFPDIKETLSLPDFDLLGFEAFNNNLVGDDQKNFIAQSLTDRFIIPPFSVFDSRQGYWQDRKKQWHALGFNSQETREDVELVAKSGQSPAIYELRNKMRESLGREPTWDEIIDEAKRKGMHIYEGSSVFDPVIAEVCYKWFCPEGGIILDPFAGGSVRGIVAGVLGYDYRGIDLREDQVTANIEQAEKLNLFDEVHPFPVWIKGDSNNILDAGIVPDGVDFIFSCPPYHDLEHYSDDPADLSNMNYVDFCDVYWSIISKSIRKLKTNRFACFVVGDIRDKEGFYRDFVSETISAFTTQVEKGELMHLYNEIILINVAGSLPIRVGRQFESGRKVGKMHQNILVFYKGDPKKIKEDFPEIKVVEYLDETSNQPNIVLH